MQALYLHIEDGVGVQYHTLVLPGEGGKGKLVLMLDVLQTLKDRLVTGVGLQLFQLLRMGEIALADQVTEQSVQTGVDLGYPAAVVDAVGDVLELVRHHLAGVLEQVLPQISECRALTPLTAMLPAMHRLAMRTPPSQIMASLAVLTGS